MKVKYENKFQVFLIYEILTFMSVSMVTYSILVSKKIKPSSFDVVLTVHRR
jgi:hypothetical protein